MQLRCSQSLGEENNTGYLSVSIAPDAAGHSLDRIFANGAATASFGPGSRWQSLPLTISRVARCLPARHWFAGSRSVDTGLVLRDFEHKRNRCQVYGASSEGWRVRQETAIRGSNPAFCDAARTSKSKGKPERPSCRRDLKWATLSQVPQNHGA